jgi:hypothetical protein
VGVGDLDEVPVGQEPAGEEDRDSDWCFGVPGEDHDEGPDGPLASHGGFAPGVDDPTWKDLSEADWRSCALSNKRADVLADLFKPGGLIDSGRPLPSTIRPRILVHVTAEMLLGLSDTPGLLDGYGPIPAKQARDLAQDGTWQAILADQVTGRVIDLGQHTWSAGSIANHTEPPPQPQPTNPTPPTPPPASPFGSPESWPSECASSGSYQPSGRVQSLIAVRDGSCRFPGCRCPAWRADTDHIIPFDKTKPASQQTTASNLQTLCRFHHRHKTLAGWTWKRDTTTGITTITSALGQTRKLAPPTNPIYPWEMNQPW